jgi:hypothetical protein
MIGVVFVVVVVVQDCLGDRAKKHIFTQEKKFLNDNKG